MDFEMETVKETVMVKQKHWDLEKAIQNWKEILMDFDSVTVKETEMD